MENSRSVQSLKETCKLAENDVILLKTLIQKEEENITKCEEKGNRDGALEAMIYKDKLEKRVVSTQTYMSSLAHQILLLESGHIMDTSVTSTKEGAEAMGKLREKLNLEELAKVSDQCIEFENHLDAVKKTLLRMFDIEAAKKKLDERQQMEADQIRLEMPTPFRSTSSQLTSLHGESSINDEPTLFSKVTKMSKILKRWFPNKSA